MQYSRSLIKQRNQGTERRGNLPKVAQQVVESAFKARESWFSQTRNPSSRHLPIPLPITACLLVVIPAKLSSRCHTVTKNKAGVGSLKTESWSTQALEPHLSRGKPLFLVTQDSQRHSQAFSSLLPYFLETPINKLFLGLSLRVGVCQAIL